MIMNKLVLYLFTGVFIIFCFFTYLFIDVNFYFLKNLYTGFAIENRVVVSVVYFAFIAVLFFLYGKILKIKELNFKKNKFLFLIPVFGILAYPAILSFDLFNYLATAKVAFSYFENPYVVMPIEFIGEPILIFTRATNKIDLYGPLWTAISGIPHYLSFGSYLAEIVLFKAFVSIFYLGIVYIIWKITKNFYCVLYFAASPLVIIETFFSGHNDVVMMFFALGSIYLLKNKKILLALVFISLSILIKYATLFLLPVFVYYFYKRLRKKEVDWDFVYLMSFALMLVIFFLSPIREEIYPWYAIWPLAFLALISEKKQIISKFFIFFTFCLMLRYIPFMLLGTYFGPTPIIKDVITFVIPGIYLIYLFSANKFKLSN